MAALPDKLRYAFTPSGGYKEGTLYSLVPNDNVGNFDVVRPTSVDRINKDGEVESVPPNVPVLDYSDGGCPKLLTGADDNITGAGDSSTFNTESGVFFADISALSEEPSEKRITISDGSNTNRLIIDCTNDLLRGFVVINGVSVFNHGQEVVSVLVNNRLSIRYKANDFSFWINGLEVASVDSGATFTNKTLNVLSFTNGDQVSSKFIGKTKSIQHWDYLTDEEMESLTGYQSYADMSQQFNFNIL